MGITKAKWQHEPPATSKVTPPNLQGYPPQLAGFIYN